jgi:hypothetical protein
LVERYEGSPGSRGVSWYTVAEDDSSHVFFLIDDGTGQALINPAGAEFDLEAPHFHCRGGGSFERHLPDNLIAFLEGRGIKYKNWLEGYSIQFKEWTIDEQDELFVLGTAHKEAFSISDFNRRLQAAIDELKSNPQDPRKVDTDKDGQISVGEWNAAVNAIRQDLLEEELQNSQVAGFPDTVIDQGEKDRDFIISKRSERRFRTRLGLYSFLGIFAGAALCIVATVLLFGGVRSAMSNDGGPAFPKTPGFKLQMNIEPQGKGIKVGKGPPNQSIRIKSYGEKIEIQTHYQDWPLGDSFEILPNGQVRKGWIPGFKETIAPDDAAGIVSVLRGVGPVPVANSLFHDIAAKVEKAQTEKTDPR